MPLDDYTFQLDTGTVLNSDVVTPFVDVERVVGLDSAPFRETIRDHEGNDGGFMDAEFEQGREIAIDGMVFADVATAEAFMDTLKGEYGPVTEPLPFYFKGPGVDERVIFVKPRGVTYDWESARRVGMTPIQFRMFAEDPRIYDNLLQSVVIPYGGEATTGLGFVNAYDTFTRSASNSWGNLNSGETWAQGDGADPATNYAVNGSRGTITHSSTNTLRGMVYEKVGVLNQHLQTSVLVPFQPTGAAIHAGLIGRFGGFDFVYWADLQFNTDNTISVRLVKRVAGVETVLSTVATGITRSDTIPMRLEFTINNEPNGASPRNRLRVKTWQEGQSYPAAWSIDTTDGDLNSGAYVGVVTRAATGNTNVSPAIQFDNYRQILGIGFDIGFGATVPPSGSFVVVGGNRPAPATLTIEGPITNPRIINETDSKTLAFEIVLGALDSMEVSLANRTVVVNGNTNRRDALQDPDWFLFNPGSTFIKFGGGGGSVILTITYRNAWR